MDPLRIFADPFGSSDGTPSYTLTHFLDDLFSIPRTADRKDRSKPTGSIPNHVDGPGAKPKRKAEAQQRAELVASMASIPIHVDSPDAKPKRKREAQQRAEPVASSAPPAVTGTGRRAPSAEEAAVRVQAAARGFLARRAVRAVRGVEREAEAAGRLVRQREEELRGDRRARVAAAEVLMRMLLRLDAVRAARDYRRKVTRRVLALQDAVDALELPKAPAAEAVAVAGDEIAEESAVAPVLEPQDAADDIEIKAAQEMATEPEVVAEGTEDAATEPTVVEIAQEAEHKGEIEVKAAAETEVDGGGADGETDAAAGSEPVSDKPADGSYAEWEIVTEDPAAAPAAAACLKEPRQEPAGQVVTSAAGDGAGIVDTRRMMEMLTALCERNAQQCALIGALVERVDALERTVRQAMKQSEEGREATAASSAAIKD